MSPPRPRIGLAFTGDPTDPAQWSGTPAGVYAGLQEAGVEVVALDVNPPGLATKAMGAALGLGHLRRAPGDTPKARLRNAYSTGLIGPASNRVRTELARRAVAAAAPLDGIVQIGTGFRVPTSVPIATLEDMTIPQALKYPYHHWNTLSKASVGRRIATQRACYEQARAVCMTSSWAAASARDDYGVAVSRLHVTGVGSNEAGRTPKRDWSAPRLLFVGFDWERKNGPAVLRAFRTLRETHPGARLDVVGGHPPLDAPGVTGHGILSREVVAEHAQMRDLFDAATMFVMPSCFEPCGIVYCEAAAVGLPSIGSSVGGSADLIADTGFVVDPASDAEILAAMRTLAEPDTAREYAARAAERGALLTWRNVAERLLRALDPDLLGRPLARGLEPVAAPL